MSGSYSRTRKSIRNSTVALTIQFLAMLVGFFSRRVFIRYLGAELMGLNTTATSILNFLNIVELGIYSAISVTLYKPLYDDDKVAVREILALQGWLYRIVAALVTLGSIIVMCFFPQIFSKTDLPLWYAYATFGVLLYSTILTYFVSYRRNLLYADQQNYKVLICTRMVALIKLACQTVSVCRSANGYLWWLALELLFATLGAILTCIVVNHSYPYLREPVEMSGSLRKKYPQVLEKVRLLALHKICQVLMNQAGPIVIYAFSSLSVVALYGNYQLLTVNLCAVISSLYSGMDASVGNMVAEGNKKLIMKVFGELFASRFLVTAISSLCLWVLTEPFISLWLGPEYVMSKSTLALVIATFFFFMSRSITASFIDAYGMFSDVWSSVAEALLNVGLSIVGGYLGALDGILGGALVSQLLIGFLWKPYFLFRRGFRENVSIYVGYYAKYVAIASVSSAAVILLSRTMEFDPSSSVAAFIGYALIIFCASALSMGSLAFLADESARNFVRRMVSVIRPRKF